MRRLIALLAVALLASACTPAQTQAFFAENLGVNLRRSQAVKIARQVRSTPCAANKAEALGFEATAEMELCVEPPLTVDGLWTAYGAATLLHDAGFRGEELVHMTATMFPESSGNASIRGDESLTTAKWGPSVGLWQIRSLWADDNTGRTRDRFALTDPAFNARAAWEVAAEAEALWGKSQRLRPWSAFTSGKWRKYETQAREAVAVLEALR